MKEHLLWNLPYVLVALVLLISHFYLRGNDLSVFLAFIVLIPVFVVFRFDGRIPVGYAILMLVLAAGVLIKGDEELANQFAIYAYWLLVVGVGCLFIEFLMENKEDNRVS